VRSVLLIAPPLSLRATKIKKGTTSQKEKIKISKKKRRKQNDKESALPA